MPWMYKVAIIVILVAIYCILFVKIDRSIEPKMQIIFETRDDDYFKDINAGLKYWEED